MVLDDACVRCDGVTLAQHDDVTDDDVGRRHHDRVAIANHRGVQRGEATKRRDGVDGAPFLPHADARVRQHDDGDDDALDRDAVGAVGPPGEQRHDNGAQQ